MLPHSNILRVASFGGLEIRSDILIQQDHSQDDHRIFEIKGELLCVSIRKTKAGISKTAAVVGSHAGSRAAGLALS
jgi:hypothetical protein